MFSRMTWFLALLLVALSAVAGQKKAWEWSVEERLSQRLDPAQIKARRLTYEADHPASVGGNATPAHSSHTIDGRRNPELFLPHELLDGLLTAFTPDPGLRSRQRELYGAGIRSLGYDDAQFWERLEAVSAAYLEMKYGRSSDRLALCRARFAALQAARNEFGGFDQLLYAVVAPWSQLSLTTDEDPGVQLRRAEEGCP